VRTGTADAERLRIGEGGRRVGGNEFVGSQGVSSDRGPGAHRLNLKLYGEEKFGANGAKW
jgi:hypothetical protein